MLYLQFMHSPTAFHAFSMSVIVPVDHITIQRWWINGSHLWHNMYWNFSIFKVYKSTGTICVLRFYLVNITKTLSSVIKLTSSQCLINSCIYNLLYSCLLIDILWLTAVCLSVCLHPFVRFINLFSIVLLLMYIVTTWDSSSGECHLRR